MLLVVRELRCIITNGIGLVHQFWEPGFFALDLSRPVRVNRFC